MEKFEKLASEQYKIFTTVIDRKVRNADAHLNAYYSVEKQQYVMKR